MQEIKTRRVSQSKYKNCLDMILIFLRQFEYPTDTENIMCKSFSTKDYTLVQFQQRVGKHIPKGEDRFR